jgi:hypothetical protein
MFQRRTTTQLKKHTAFTNRYDGDNQKATDKPKITKPEKPSKIGKNKDSKLESMIRTPKDKDLFSSSESVSDELLSELLNSHSKSPKIDQRAELELLRSSLQEVSDALKQENSKTLALKQEVQDMSFQLTRAMTDIERLETEFRDERNRIIALLPSKTLAPPEDLSYNQRELELGN